VSHIEVVCQRGYVSHGDSKDNKDTPIMRILWIRRTAKTRKIERTTKATKTMRPPKTTRTIKTEKTTRTTKIMRTSRTTKKREIKIRGARRKRM
jgi:hypothetical protein